MIKFKQIKKNKSFICRSGCFIKTSRTHAECLHSYIYKYLSHFEFDLNMDVLEYTNENMKQFTFNKSEDIMMCDNTKRIID